MLQRGGAGLDQKRQGAAGLPAQRGAYRLDALDEDGALRTLGSLSMRRQSTPGCKARSARLLVGSTHGTRLKRHSTLCCRSSSRLRPRALALR